MTDLLSPADALSRTVQQLPAGPLSSVRDRAARVFSRSGFPTTQQEDWRYTNLAPVAELGEAWLRTGPWAPPAPPAAFASSLDRVRSRIEAAWIAIFNGQVWIGGDEALEAGVVIQPISANPAAAALLRTDSPLEALNAALLTDGILIQVAPGTRAQRPVGLLILDSDSDENRFSQARVIVECGPGSAFELIELHESTGSNAQASNTVSQFDLRAGSQVRYTRIVDRAASHLHTGKVAARIGQDACFRCANFDLGGALIRNDVEVDLAEPGATVELNGLYLGSGKQHIDNHTRVDHRVGPSESQEEYRGLLTGDSRCVFNGKAVVHAGADGSDAHQANHNILLSQRAEIDTKPELEIYADEVKCSHGATVGQLDRTALFYLRSRGLDQQTAMRVLTRAFATKIVDASPVSAAHDFLSERTEVRLTEIVTGEAE
jgi:Fe-S cluster assembly protein SufD